MKTMVTRIGYCEKCYSAKRPQGGQHFLVYGSTSDTMYLEDVKSRNATRGFVPHIFLLIEHDYDEVKYRKVCCMCDCGAIYFPNKEDENLSEAIVNEEEWSEELTMPTTRWNALVLLKDTGLEI